MLWAPTGHGAPSADCPCHLTTPQDYELLGMNVCHISGSPLESTGSAHCISEVQ